MVIVAMVKSITLHLPVDAENTEMLLPDNVRGFRRNHGDSYPNEDEHLLNGHHIPKQQQQPQHLFQHQNYSEEYCSIEETHMMRNIKEESKHLLEHRYMNVIEIIYHY